MTRRILLFICIIVLTLISGIILPRQWLLPVFNDCGYYFILVAFVLWALLFIRTVYGRTGLLLRTHYPALLLCTGVMALAFHLSPPQFKILSDEANLVGVSMAMHEDKTVSLPVQGLGIDYSDYDYTGSIDQRPLGYPFSISVCHALLGYSPSNGFVVNFVVGVLILFFVYLLLTRFFPRFYGFLGVLMTAACPVFLYWVTSSGFEALNLFLVVFVFFALYEFLNSRKVDQAELLFLSLVLLANCRYESVIFLIGMAVLWPYFTGRDMIAQYRLPTFLCPVLLLPLIWQRRLYFFSAAVQFGDTRLAPDHLFGLGNLADHFSSNLFVLTGLNSNFGFLPVVFLLAVFGLYGLLKRWISPVDRLTDISRPVVLYGLVCGVSLFLFYSSFYWGDFTLAIDNRLAMVFIPFLIVPAVYMAHRWLEGADRPWKAAIIFLAFIQIIYYWPVAEKQVLIQKKSLTYEYNAVLGYIKDHYDLNREKLLIISDRTNLYTIHQLGSVGFDYANQHVPQLRFWKRIYFSHVLVLQRPDARTGEMRREQVLAGDYRLHHLTEIPISTDYCLRISEADIQ